MSARSTLRRRSSHSRTIPVLPEFRHLQLESLEGRVLLSATASQQTLDLFSVSPALFVENRGQWADDSVRLVHSGDGANVALADDGVRFQVFRREPRAVSDSTAVVAGATSVVARSPDLATDARTEGLPPTSISGGDSVAETFGRDIGGVEDPRRTLGGLDPDAYDTRMLQFSASYVGANSVRPTGLGPSATRFNYFLGEQSNWRADVPAYEVAAYEGLYDGIDLHAAGQRSHLKYEFHVAAGADWSQVQVHYDGIAGLSLADDGSLVVDLGGDWGTILDDAPYIYQQIDGQRVEVPGRFVLLDRTTYSFDVTGPYDPAREMVIDPDLAWSTYLGGNGYDEGFGIAVDAADNVLVTGWTNSSGWVSGGFDTTFNGSYDAFVAKIGPTGAHLWSTYLGGSADDLGRGIAVDTAGNALVTGRTGSAGWVSGGFDTTFNGNYDAFVAQLSPSGAHLWSTYLGGNAEEYGHGIAVDTAGDTLVTGYTYSAGWVSGGFDTIWNGAADAFVAKIGPTGAHLWSTYLGGSADDLGDGIAVDTAGNALATGGTRSSGWVSGGFDTTYNGVYDAFVAKLSPSGAHLWSTYLGGNADDYGHGIAVDTAGNALVTGYSYSSGWVSGGFDTTWNGAADAFVAKIGPTGDHRWSTYLGGNADDHAHGIAVGTAGNILVTGYSYSSGWVSGGFDTTWNGAADAFVAKIGDPIAVTNTLDAGAGSLRQAILDVNALAGANTIAFAIPGAGPHVINLATALPNLLDVVTMDVRLGMQVEVGGASAFGFPDFATLAKIGAGTIVFSGGDVRISGDSLAIDAGLLRFRDAGAGLLAVHSLAVAPGAKLDLNDGDLVVHATPATRAAVLAQITGLVASGAANLTWTGPGIGSSAAASDPNLLTALGVMLNDNGLGGAYYPSFSGEPVDANSILVKYTYYGDADLSGLVDGTDYALTDNGFNAVLTGWFNGDFNYTATIDGTDYALIDNGFNSHGGPLAGGEPVGLGPIPRAADGAEAIRSRSDRSTLRHTGELAVALGDWPDDALLSLAADEIAGAVLNRARRR